MSLSVTKGEGVTVLTVASDPKSEVPLVLQLLVSLCCSPVCYVSQRLRRLFPGTQTALGTVQIMVGLFNIGLGVIRLSAHLTFLDWIFAPYWLGGLFIAAGIICILGERFPSPCLVFLTALMNLATTCLAVTAIVLYSADLYRVLDLRYTCNSFEISTPEPEPYYRYRYRTATQSPEEVIAQRIAYQQSSRTNFEICQSNRNLLMVMLGGIDILLILFAVLQLCVTITAAVLSLKALCQKKTEGKPDPELNKPLMEEVTPNSTV